MMVVSCPGPPVHPNGTCRGQWEQTSGPTSNKKLLQPQGLYTDEFSNNNQIENSKPKQNPCVTKNENR